jgi:hypothetical protein
MIYGIDAFYLSPELSVLAVLLCCGIVASGRPEWGLGIYLAMVGWTRNIFVGSVAQTWVLMATTVAAAVVYVVRHRRQLTLPRHDRWIVLWVVIWWGWMLLLMGSHAPLFAPDGLVTLLRTLFLYVIFPLPVILLFKNDVGCLRGFTIAYIFTAIAGGVASLIALQVPLRYVLSDPTLRDLDIINLGIKNYHWIGNMFGVSLVLIVALLTEGRRTHVRLALILAASFCTYFLILAGSRQSIIASVAASVAIILWSELHAGTPKLSAVLLITVVILVAYVLVQVAPQLVFRAELGEAEITDLSTSFGTQRDPLRTRAWLDFLQSPIWGTGLVRHSSGHNIFISTLSDQGVVGMIFFAGWLLFLIRQMRGVWRGSGQHDLDVWRAGLVGVLLLAMVQSQASGTPLSVWHLWWPGVFLWKLRETAGLVAGTHPATEPLRIRSRWLRKLTWKRTRGRVEGWASVSARR